MPTKKAPVEFMVVPWGIGVDTAKLENAIRRANAVQKNTSIFIAGLDLRCRSMRDGGSRR